MTHLFIFTPLSGHNLVLFSLIILNPFANLTLIAESDIRNQGTGA